MISKLLSKLKSAFERKPIEQPINRVLFVDSDGVSKEGELVVRELMKSFDATYIVKTVGKVAQKEERKRVSSLFIGAEIILFDAVGKEAVDKIIAMKMIHMAMTKNTKQFALISHDADFVDVAVYGKSICPDINTNMILINDGNREKIRGLIKKCRMRNQIFTLVSMKSTTKKIAKSIDLGTSKFHGQISKDSIRRIMAICKEVVDEAGSMTTTHFRWLMKHHEIFTDKVSPDVVVNALTMNGLAVIKQQQQVIHFPQFSK